MHHVTPYCYNEIVNNKNLCCFMSIYNYRMFLTLIKLLKNFTMLVYCLLLC